MVERPERTRLGGETVDGLDAFVRRRVGGHRRLLVVLHEAAATAYHRPFHVPYLVADIFARRCNSRRKGVVGDIVGRADSVVRQCLHLHAGIGIAARLRLLDIVIDIGDGARRHGLVEVVERRVELPLVLPPLLVGRLVGHVAHQKILASGHQRTAGHQQQERCAGEVSFDMIDIVHNCLLFRCYRLEIHIQTDGIGLEHRVGGVRALRLGVDQLDLGEGEGILHVHVNTEVTGMDLLGQRLEVVAQLHVLDTDEGAVLLPEGRQQRIVARIGRHARQFGVAVGILGLPVVEVPALGRTAVLRIERVRDQPLIEDRHVSHAVDLHVEVEVLPAEREVAVVDAVRILVAQRHAVVGRNHLVAVGIHVADVAGQLRRSRR